MTKLTKETMFTELSIQIAVLQASVDKLLELTMQPKYNPKDHERGGTGKYSTEKEVQPVNVADYAVGCLDSSYDEQFRDNFK